MTVSVSSQIQDNAMQLNAMLLQNAMETSAKIREIQPEVKEQLYAEEGDKNYDEAMDENGDGKITYTEYMKYCEDQQSTRTSKQQERAETEKTADTETGKEQFAIKNAGKSINQYAKVEQPQPQIREEA